MSSLLLRSENRCSDILMNDSFMYSLSVNCFLCCTISKDATKLAAVVEFGDLIHFFKEVYCPQLAAEFKNDLFLLSMSSDIAFFVVGKFLATYHR